MEQNTTPNTQHINTNINTNTRSKGKTLLIAGILGILVIGSILAVWISRQQTDQRTRAAASTSLSFSPSSQSVGIGQSVTADVHLDPGKNQISVLKLVISYDSNKFDKTNVSLTPVLDTSSGLDAQGFTQILEQPSYTNCTGTTCKMSVSLSIGSSPTKVITRPLKVATISLKAKESTNADATPISIDSLSAAYSLGSTDEANENVISFSSLTPLLVTIGNTVVTGTPPPSACIPDQSTCQWDSVAGVASYHYKVTDATTGIVIKEGDVDGGQTSVTFPSTSGKTYTCSVTATNTCSATSKAGSATQTCQLTPTPSIPTPSSCPTPGSVRNLRMICPNCPAQ